MTYCENFTVYQTMTRAKLIEIVFSEESVSNLLKSQGPLDLKSSEKTIAHINNKKYKITMTSDIKNFENYRTLNHTAVNNKDDKIEVEELDIDKEWCMHNGKKVMCRDLKNMYIWFYTTVNDFGTFSNKLDYMTYVRQLNTVKAKMLVLIEDLVTNVDYPVENNLSEISFNDLIISLYFRKEKKFNKNYSENPIMKWIDTFENSIEMDKSKIKQRVEIIELRKLFWQIDKNRSDKIDFNEY